MKSISIEVDGEVQLDRALKGVEQHVEDFRPVWPDVAKAFYEIEEDLFRAGGYGMWPDLNPDYEEWKASKAGFGPTAYVSKMILTGNLQDSLTGRNSVHAVKDLENPTEMSVGTNLVYAGSHMRPYKSRPARPPIYLREQDKERIAKVIVKRLREFTRGLGFTGQDTGTFD